MLTDLIFDTYKVKKTSQKHQANNYQSNSLLVPIVKNLIGFTRKAFNFNYQIELSPQVSLSIKDFFTHILVTGQTGTGKSGLAVVLATQLINQKKQVLFIDPHNSCIKDILERINSNQLSSVNYLSLNQKNLSIGYNPLLVLDSHQQLDNKVTSLLNSIFFDVIENGFQVVNCASLILESVVYFHNCYIDFLSQEKGLQLKEIELIMKEKQLTFNDLANFNSSLATLFIKYLGYKESNYNRPDLVAKWNEYLDKPTSLKGLDGVIGRFSKLTATSEARLFFESKGFNVLELLESGQSVLCDLRGLDKFTMSIISKILFNEVFNYKVKGKLRKDLLMFIDEAKIVKVPNLDEIVEQARKFRLGLVLMCQHIGQFENKALEKTLNNTIVTKIQFRNREADSQEDLEQIKILQDQHFKISSKYHNKTNQKVKNWGQPKRVHTQKESGFSYYLLTDKIQKKQLSFINYFKA